MLPTIQTSETFKEEYTKYQNMINQLPDGTFKTETMQLLTKLITEVKRLDGGHAEMTASRRMPTMTTEVRENIVGIRKQLDRKYRDWQNRN